MKLKLTEQQVRGLIKNLSEQEMDFEKEAPNLSKFAKFITGAQSANINQTPVSDEPQFAPDIPNNDDMIHPLGKKSGVSSAFGNRMSSIGSKNHKGIDIPIPSNSPVYAPLDGIVSASRDTTPNACGGFIKLDHSTMTTKFCHLSRMVVQSGQKVKKGQIIGYSGGGPNDPHPGTSTGPHLHYEILNKSGIAMNPSTVQKNLA